jgi:hypothetical protein
MPSEWFGVMFFEYEKIIRVMDGEKQVAVS